MWEGVFRIIKFAGVCVNTAHSPCEPRLRRRLIVHEYLTRHNERWANLIVPNKAVKLLQNCGGDGQMPCLWWIGQFYNVTSSFKFCLHYPVDWNEIKYSVYPVLCFKFLFCLQKALSSFQDRRIRELTVRRWIPVLKERSSH